VKGENKYYAIEGNLGLHGDDEGGCRKMLVKKA
jgi:hypothetical protein